MATGAERATPDDGSARRLEPANGAAQPASNAQQLALDLHSAQRPEKPRHTSSASAAARLGPRLALSPDEAAAVLGVSRDYLDEHIIRELRIVRRGRRILIALAELERWLDRAATGGAGSGRGTLA